MAGFLAMLTVFTTLFTNGTTAFAASPSANIAFWHASTKDSGEVSELKPGYNHGKILYAVIDGNAAYCIYRIAGYVEECNRFLSNASGGKVSVEDLSIERRVTGWYINSENIVGLPSVIASSLNYADSTDKYYDYKQMIHSILKYKQEHGEIPQYHMNFKWSGKELKC